MGLTNSMSRRRRRKQRLKNFLYPRTIRQVRPQVTDKCPCLCRVMSEVEDRSFVGGLSRGWGQVEGSSTPMSTCDGVGGIVCQERPIKHLHRREIRSEGSVNTTFDLSSLDTSLLSLEEGKRERGSKGEPKGFLSR